MSASESIKGATGSLLFTQPTGNNDVYWCHALGGPTVVLGQSNVCSRCGQRLADDPNVHTFAVHVEMGEPEPSVYEKRGVLSV
jgi:hypothetical protein